MHSSEPMECAIVTPHRYGIYEMSQRVGEMWGQWGHDVEFVLAEGRAANVGPINAGAPAISLWWYRRLTELASRDRLPDLIWAHQPILPILPTGDTEFWERVVLTIHSTHTREYELTRTEAYPSRLRPYYWFVSRLEQRFHRRVQKLSGAGPKYTVVSPHLEDELSKLGVPQAEYVPNGVFTPDPDTLEPIRHEYDVPNDATVVFYVGSLSTQKRPDVLARLLSEAVTRLDDTYCFVAGTGSYHDQVARYENSHFRSLGYITDEEKWRWFADSDIFASLSAYEGMPVASAEALSFGLPLLLSNIPAHRHLLSEYGATGILVGDDVAEVTDAIRTLSGERTQASLPTWEGVAERYLDIAKTRRQ